MTTASTTVRGRVDPSPRTLGIAIGDAAAIGLFVVAGEISHGIDPLAAPALVADTLAPFLVGWFVVALGAGLYGPGLGAGPVRAAGRTLGAWAAAVAIAQGLRATALFHGDAALAFALVSVAVGGAFLVGWRAAVALLRRRSSRPG